MKRITNIMTLLALLTVKASAEEAKLDSLTAVPIQQVIIDDDFWSPKIKVWQEITIPDCLTKFENDHGGAINNFDRVRDGKTGDHAGPEWYDGLIYEMIRGSADFLIIHPDPKLKDRIENYITRIAAAADRDPDGYIETWTQLMAPNHRWGLNGGNDVQQHELYNAGALIDAGIHWYRATGETNLLRVAVRMANNMCDLMGPPPKVNQVPGHSLGEESLVRLYQLFREQPQLKAQLSVPVNERNYLNLAEFWIENRGNHEGRSLNWGAYAQDDKPVLQQKEMEGHAVRDGLMCAGLVAVGQAADREDFLAEAQHLWDNMTYCKMYLTGGLGAGLGIEGFGNNYYLPNNTAYTETCAAAAGGFFDANMGLVYGDARYADALERELFNGALVGVSLKGDSYFYDNPIETETPHERWAWHGCPCCPPMFLKLMGALPGYIYAQRPGAVYVNQFIGSRASVKVNDSNVTLEQTTRYPWDGQVKIAVNPKKAGKFELYVRIPEWCQGVSSSDDLYDIVGRPVSGAATLKVNGKPVKKLDMIRGYARLDREWKDGDVVELNLDMPVRRVLANTKVEADRGLLALTRGPIVYCAESADNLGGIQHLVIDPASSFETEFKPNLLGGIVVLHGQVKASMSEHGTNHLVPANLEAIPYYANDNRGPSTIRVWLPAIPEKAVPATLAIRSQAKSSYCWHLDSVDAINDGIVPAKSGDTSLPRLSWWDHKGTAEWAELDFPEATTVSKAQVFWFADGSANGGCDVPENWTLLYKVGDSWKPVEQPNNYGVAVDAFNKVTFAPVETTALRIQAQLKPRRSGGICEWEAE